MHRELVLLWTLAVAISPLSFMQQSASPDLSAIDIEGSPGLILSDGSSSCRLGWLPENTFGLEFADTSVLTVDRAGDLTLNNQVLTQANILVGTSLSMSGVAQWKLIQLETFDGPQADGWSVTEVTTCGGVNMMGGYCELASESTTKTFSSLPVHSQLRIVATYHFIDQWEGETGFLRTEVGNSLSIVWTDRHTLGPNATGYNVCGSSQYPETRFSVLVDVSIAHTSSSVTVEFGSTLDEQSCTHSYGVSGFQIYAR